MLPFLWLKKHDIFQPNIRHIFHDIDVGSVEETHPTNPPCPPGQYHDIFCILIYDIFGGNHDIIKKQFSSLKKTFFFDFFPIFQKIYIIIWIEYECMAFVSMYRRVHGIFVVRQSVTLISVFVDFVSY